ncbi:MAG TPA: PAS domain-containing sensor histidine kinase [Dehalococcoidales bacterium]|nr:PAS domain-containing sensor histidine kinase [Dehalococcoidales bacterium]
MPQPKARNLKKENEELRQKLETAEETLRAINCGEVDALMVSTNLGEQVFTLQGADTPYRIALENITEGVVTLSTGGTILYANRYFAQMMRADLNKVIGASIFDFAGIESHEFLWGLLGHDGRGEITFRSGAAVPCFIATRKLKLDNLDSICAVITDLTQQKKDEEVIRAGHVIQSMLAQTPDAVIVCAGEGKITYTSQAAIHMFGPAVGQNMDKLLQNIRVDGQPLCFDNLKRGSFKVDKTTLCTRENGETRYFLLRSNSFGPGIEPAGYVVTLTDVTDLKKAEQIKDDFIGMVSHEIRTPLTILIGALATAQMDGISEEEARSMLQDAMEGAEMLDQIVGNLIELSRYQSDRLTLQMELIDFSGFLRSIINKEKRIVGKHRLTVELPDVLPPVHADKVRLELIVTNLLSNASKYSPDDTEIRMSIREDGHNLLVNISDQGIGISTEQQATIFQPFVRLENKAMQAKGLGLGLLVCRRLVEAHGGKIWVDSARDKGSSFSFTLPL